MQVHREEAAIRGRDADVVFIGSGSPQGAIAFERRLGFDVKVYAAPRETYRAVGMRRGVLATLRSGRLLAGFARKKLRRLAGTGRTGSQARGAAPPIGAGGDRWQLGGVLVVRPGGEVAFSYASGKAGDHPRVEAIVRAIAPAA